MNRLNENARTKLHQEEVAGSPSELAERFREVLRLRMLVRQFERSSIGPSDAENGSGRK
jgi:hypothetical protein